MTERKKIQPKPQTNKRKRKLTAVEIGLISTGATLVVAFLGFLGVVINSYFTSQATQASVIIPIHVTQTVEARLSSLTSIVSTAMPTMTPISAPYASVIVFSVLQNGKVIYTVKPKEITKEMMVGSTFDIRAEVSTNVDVNDLKFTWYTCQYGDHIVQWGDGVFEIPYKVPKVAADCIRVKIEKGGTVLYNNSIHVNVKK